MVDAVIASTWDLVTGAIALRSSVYQNIELIPLGNHIAFGVVLLAGLSEAIAQAIVLFLNRVKPFRFVVSLAIATILFVFAFLFWASSTWIVSILLFQQQVTLLSLTRTLALSYAPKLLSIFIALPYLGVPVSITLSIWSFLAFLVGIRATLGLGLVQAFWCGVLGWIVFQALENTIGRPFALLGQWLRNTVAGVALVTDLKELEDFVKRGNRS